MTNARTKALKHLIDYHGEDVVAQMFLYYLENNDDLTDFTLSFEYEFDLTMRTAEIAVDHLDLLLGPQEETA